MTSDEPSVDVPQDDVEEFIDYIRQKHDDEVLADYFTLMVEDYEENGTILNPDRYFRVEQMDDADISVLIDLAVVFGWVWERDDPMEEYDG